MNQALRITLFSALGAGIGVQIMNQFFELAPFLVWTGPIIGGFAGYLLYDIKELLEAIRSSWNAVVGWKPVERCKIFGKTFMYAMSIYSLMIVVLAVLVLPPLWLIGSGGLASTLLLGGVVVTLAVSFLFGTVFALMDNEEDQGTLMLKDTAVYMYMSAWKFIRKILPWLKRSAWPVIKRLPMDLWSHRYIVPMIAYMSKNFIWHIYIRIHSEARLIVFVDAFLGSLIGGYFFQNALVGALIGGIFGFVNYAMVSRRILKVEVS